MNPWTAIAAAALLAAVCWCGTVTVIRWSSARRLRAQTAPRPTVAARICPCDRH